MDSISPAKLPQESQIDAQIKVKNLDFHHTLCDKNIQEPIIASIEHSTKCTNEIVAELKPEIRSDCVRSKQIKSGECPQTNTNQYKSIQTNTNQPTSRSMLLKSQSLDLFNENQPNSTEKTENFNLTEISNSISKITKNIDQGFRLNNGCIQKFPSKISHNDLKYQSAECRPIYPNVPYSPYASPYGSPRCNRRRPIFRESRKISMEKSGSFLQLNQYKLMEQIGQVSKKLKLKLQKCIR